VVENGINITERAFRYGRFILFITTVINGINTTERAFRDHWNRTDKNLTVQKTKGRDSSITGAFRGVLLRVYFPSTENPQMPRVSTPLVKLVAFPEPDFDASPILDIIARLSWRRARKTDRWGRPQIPHEYTHTKFALGL